MHLGRLKYLRLNFVSLYCNIFYLSSYLDFMLNLIDELSCPSSNFLEEISSYISSSCKFFRLQWFVDDLIPIMQL